MGLATTNLGNSLGYNGCTFINTASGAVAGKFNSIQFTEDSTVTAITGPMENSADFIAQGTTFSQGQVIYLPISSITISGAGILYKA